MSLSLCVFVWRVVVVVFQELPIPYLPSIRRVRWARCRILSLFRLILESGGEWTLTPLVTGLRKELTRWTAAVVALCGFLYGTLPVNCLRINCVEYKEIFDAQAVRSVVPARQDACCKRESIKHSNLLGSVLDGSGFYFPFSGIVFTGFICFICSGSRSEVHRRVCCFIALAKPRARVDAWVVYCYS